MGISEFLDNVDIAHFESSEEFWERLHGLPNKDVAVIARTIFQERPPKAKRAPDPLQRNTGCGAA